MRLKLEQILFSQGFGTRYDCRSLVRSGQVKINQVVKTDPDETVETQNLKFEVRGQLWLYKEKAIIALNKPSGYECSQKPIHHPSVMTLLPSPLRRRGVQPVGRLDEDTTGLLILTDDGILQHRLIHPKKHVAKTYRVSCKHPCSDLFFERLLQGVLLDGEKVPVKAFELKKGIQVKAPLKKPPKSEATFAVVFFSAVLSMLILYKSSSQISHLLI